MKGERPSREDVNLTYAPQCWEELWDLANKCWSEDPSDRPKMKYIVDYLNEVREKWDGRTS